MTTPSIEERLRRFRASPGQPATKADLAELWSALRIRDSERRAEMNRRENERDLRAIKFESEMRTRETERDIRALKFQSEMRTRETERDIRAFEFQSEMRTRESERNARALKFQSEMRTRESERIVQHYERKHRKSEKRWDAIWRGTIVLYVVLFVAAVIILATSFL